MYEVSSTGISVRVVATETFPSGFTVTEFSDDGDPIDIPELTIAESAMNINGDLVTWSSPAPLAATMSVIPSSDADMNLSAILEANRAAKNKSVARDIITLVVNYPDGSSATLSGGKMTAGVPAKGPTQDGRLKSKSFTFAFQNFSSSQ